jgi:hypothetical protein
LISLLSLLLIPLLGIFIILIDTSYGLSFIPNRQIKYMGLVTTIINLIISLIIFILFDFSGKQFQFIQIQEYYKTSYFDIYLGIDGISIYFVLLTTIIIPICLLSNWNTIQSYNVLSFIIIILLLETLLLAVFLVLDILLFYIFFESILPPLFLLIGLFGSSNKVRASFYLFLYTLLGSLFMLLSIITMSSIMGTTDFDALSKANYSYIIQLFLFSGIFLSFAVKTPTIFLNTWLLKAHVESPLAGSIILAGITMPALTLANCWKNLLFRLISRKLFLNSNLNDTFWKNVLFKLEIINKYIKFINKNPNRFFRDYMLKAIKNYNNYTTYKGNSKNLGSYLAGLIEGDGSIYIPKDNKNASRIRIAFNSKDLPLALIIQKNLNGGNIYKKKGKNAYTYEISDIKNLIKLVDLVNGNMRTPKIVQLYKLIDWINNKNYNIIKLPLDISTLDSNAWLSGFIEADGCFYVRITQNKHASTKKIATMLELAQKMTNLNSDSLMDIMTKISHFLSINIKIRSKYNQYWIRTSSVQSNFILIKYLETYPLFSSKYLDFVAWTKIFNLILEKKHRDNLTSIIKYKENMNSKRTYFNWNHLNNFYK